MSQFLSSAAQLFQPIGLGFTMIYFYGILARSVRTTWTLNLIMGALMGFAAIVSMAQTVILSEGFMIDARLVFVAIAVAMFGWLAGLTAATITILTRIGMGGEGAMLGCFTVVWTVGVALGWRHVLRPRVTRAVGRLALAGLTVTHMWVGLLLPAPLNVTYFTQIGPYLVAVHMFGTVLLAWLLSRERLMVDEAQTLRTAAETDPLTATLNRRSACQLVERLNSGPFEANGRALLLFDIDRFKSINDTHGHPVGDEILTSVTRRLRNCLRGSDVICRLGGDEFSIILPDTSQATAYEIAERCRATISDRPFTVDDLILTVSTSIGLSWSPLPPSFDEHVAAGDDALYEAKRAGRNRVATAPPVIRTDGTCAKQCEKDAGPLARAS